MTDVWKARARMMLAILAVLAVMTASFGASAEFAVEQTDYEIQQGSMLRIIGQYSPQHARERIYHALYDSSGKGIAAYYVEETSPVAGSKALWLFTTGLPVGSYRVNVYSAWYSDDEGKWTRNEGIARCTLSVVENQPERWDRESDYTVHYNAAGEKDVGLTAIDGELYFFSPEGVLQANGWAVVDGNSYYFDGIGRAAKGLATIGGACYFFDGQHIMQTGLKEIDGQLYYFGSDGKSVTGSVAVDGQNYYFGEDGRGITGRVFVEGIRRYYERGMEKPDPAIEQTASFVRRCYRLILGREADEGGLNNWVNQLVSGSSGAAGIIGSFLSSQEFIGQNKTGGETVDILYNTMLDRPADDAGKAHWEGVLNQEGGNNAVINGFCGSQEFLTLCDEYGIEAGSVSDGGTSRTGLEGFVERCYTEALGRQADEGGFSNWCSILREKRQTPQEVAAGFVFSQEMNAAGKLHSDPDSLLNSLYRLYLGREADPEGREYWKQQIAGGLSLEDLNAGFALSAEFAGIVAGYGLN